VCTRDWHLMCPCRLYKNCLLLLPLCLTSEVVHSFFHSLILFDSRVNYFLPFACFPLLQNIEYSSLLEEQISEAAVFYKSTLLYDVQQLIETNQYHHAAQQLLDAMAFACSNVITFRQLLIRYDAFCRTYAGMPLNEWHLQRSVLDVDHPVHGLFSFEGVVELEKRIVMGLQQQNDGVSNQESERKTLTAEAFTIQVQSFVYLLNKTHSSLEKAVAGHLVFKDRMLASVMRMKQYLFFGLGSRKYK
jgi:hypothetical protein